MRKLFLFDIDGTIAESSLAVGLEMKQQIRKCISNGNHVGIVGGGKLEKVLIQLGDLYMHHYFTECGCVYHKNKNMNINENNLELVPVHIKNIRMHPLYHKINILVKKALSFLSQVDYTITGNFIDLRNGIIYISLIGMNATNDERTYFFALDKIHSYRKQLISILQQSAEEIGIIDKVIISEGGMVGIGVYPKEYDKVQVIEYVKDDYDEIHYFGDKYEEDGNDFHLLHHHLIIGHNVNNVSDTIYILNELNHFSR